MIHPIALKGYSVVFEIRRIILFKNLTIVMVNLIYTQIKKNPN